MLKGEDIVVAPKLAVSESDWTVRSLADETEIARSVVQRALKLLAVAGLVDERRRCVNAARLEEFLVYGVRYVFPANPLGDVRGIALAPLHPAVAESARRDPALGELPVIVDALRVGDARLRGVAAELLRERLGVAAAA